MPKKGITIAIEAQEVKKLKQLSGYTSVFMSLVITEFFKRISVEEVWKAMEMEKPDLDKKKRIDKLKSLVKNVFDQTYQKALNSKSNSSVKVEDYWTITSTEKTS